MSGAEMTDLPEVHIDAIHRVVDDGLHNAFTDLVQFKGKFFLTHRSCPEGHMIFPTSKIHILTSDDGIGGWQPVFEFSVPERDVRDPHFLIFDDRLFVYSGTWLCPPEGNPRDMNDHLGYAACTDDGASWDGPTMLEGTYGHYIWRAAAFDGRAYLCGRRRRGFAPGQDENRRELIQAAMLSSEDGLNWRHAGLFADGYGDETAFLFEPDGSVLALVRGADPVPARISRMRSPYDHFEHVELDRNVGGPLLARWGNRLLVGGRKVLKPDRPVTTLYWLADDQLHEICELPSGGDNSYPGFVDLGDDRGLLSFYSSHEGSGRGTAPCHIYLAELSLD